MDKIALLMRRLGYNFSDSSLLILALTHRSKGAKNYERLEFLGDSILGFVIAEWLFERFPEESEGKLSRMRSSLVRKETLAVVARNLQLGDDLILGEGELKSGGFNRDSILSDTVESIIGAIYLDAGLAKTKKFILTNFAEILSTTNPEISFKDPKSKLQEAMQKRSMSLPSYSIIKTEGADHKQQFTVVCKLNELPIEASASAPSRRRAEQKSATLVLQQLAELG